MFCFCNWRLLAEINCFSGVIKDKLTLNPCPYYFFSFNWFPTVRRVPWVTIPIRWHKASAYYIIWVVKNNDLFSWHLAKTYHICRRLSGSNPVEGSSKKTIFGSPTRLIAMESLLFIPPDNELARKFVNLDNLTYSIAYLIFDYKLIEGMPLSRA